MFRPPTQHERDLDVHVDTSDRLAQRSSTLSSLPVRTGVTPRCEILRCLCDGTLHPARELLRLSQGFCPAPTGLARVWLRILSPEDRGRESRRPRTRLRGPPGGLSETPAVLRRSPLPGLGVHIPFSRSHSGPFCGTGIRVDTVVKVPVVKISRFLFRLSRLNLSYILSHSTGGRGGPDPSGGVPSELRVPGLGGDLPFHVRL